MNNTVFRTPLAKWWLAATLIATTASAGPPDTLWTRTFGTANTDGAEAVAVARDSGYLVAGFQNGYTATRPWFIHTDRSGNPTWQTNLSSGQALDICPTADGGSIVCGWYKRTYPDTSVDAWVSKRNAAGGQVWYRSFADASRWWDERTMAVTETRDSGCFAAVGKVMTGGHVIVARLGTAGETLWTRSYAPRWYWSVPSWVGETPDGGCAVAGHSSAGSESDFFLLHAGPRGETLWSRTWGGTAEDRAWAGCATRDNGFALCGYTRSFGSGGDDVWVVRADSSGDTLWSRTFGSTGNEQGFGISETPDRGFLICGYAGSAPWLIRTDSSGDTLWTRALPGGGRFNSVSPTPEGDIIVAGQKGTDAWLVKLAGQSGLQAEEEPRRVRPHTATIVRSVLYLADAGPVDLLDATGRPVARLAPGENYLGQLPTGVYFLTSALAGPAARYTILKQ